MHVLLLKEPRDGESGPDPYIKVILVEFWLKKQYILLF